MLLNVAYYKLWILLKHWTKNTFMLKKLFILMVNVNSILSSKVFILGESF